jgi:ATP-binding cassette subfamily B protein
MSDYLQDEENFTSQKFDWLVWKKILAFMKPLKKYAIMGLLAVIVLAITDIIYPYISAFAIDDIITPNIDNGTQDLSKLPILITYFIIFMIVQAAMVYLFIIFAGKVQNELAFNIREKAFNHLQELPFSY